MSKEEEVYLARLRARALQYRGRVEAGELRPELASFELLASIFDAAEAGVDNASLVEMMPSTSWQTNTISVPVALLRPIVEGWMRYRSAADAVTMGEAFRLEGGGQGKQPTRKLERTKDAQQKLANRAVLEYFAAKEAYERFKLEGKRTGSPPRASWERAYSRVAELFEVSEGSVKSARRKYGGPAEAACAAMLGKKLREASNSNES